jgi:hypothetical protein
MIEYARNTKPNPSEMVLLQRSVSNLSLFIDHSYSFILMITLPRERPCS